MGNTQMTPGLLNIDISYLISQTRKATLLNTDIYVFEELYH